MLRELRISIRENMDDIFIPGEQKINAAT